MKNIRIKNLDCYSKTNDTPLAKEVVNSLETPYCSKIDVYGDGSIFIRLKAESKTINTIPLFVAGIVQREDEITIVEDNGDFSLVEDTIKGRDYSSISDLFFDLASSLIKNDSEFLSQMEKEAEDTEEAIMNGADTNFYSLLTKRKRIVGQFEAFYMDMISILDVLEEIEGKSNKSLERKLSRLQVYARRICQNITEIRSEGESLQIEKENRTMGLLTVITTIFLPLTLLTGWYGMNWKSMKELDWKWGYAVFIIVAVLIVMIEVLFFIKRDLFIRNKRKNKGKGQSI